MRQGHLLAAGDKLLALDPDDPEAALQASRRLRRRRTRRLVRKFSAATSTAARKTGGSRPDKEAEEVARGRRGGLCQAGGTVCGLRTIPRGARVSGSPR